MTQHPNSLLDEIFDTALSGPRIFSQKSVLFHEYVPSRLLFREDQTRSLAYLFSPLLRGERSSNVFIYGKPGTGKTVVTKLVISKLQDRAHRAGAPISFCYVNCRVEGSEYRVAASLARTLGQDIPFTGLSVKEVFNRFTTALFSAGVTLLVVLDEIDCLVSRYGDDLLYMLTRLNKPQAESSIVIVGISNDVRFKEYLDPRVLSTLSEEEVVFTPYNSIELEAILSARVSHAFQDGVVAPEALQLCASISGSQHGDARRALDLLRLAGELVERSGGPVVTVQHIHLAEQTMEKDRVTEVVHSLPLHSKLVLAAVLNCLEETKARVRSSIIYGRYVSLSRDLGTRALSSRRVLGLLRELSLLGLVDKRVENYGRRGGRVTMVELDAPLGLVRRALSDDALVAELFS
ncbi:MAG: Cdc6/Cdc18 family protein [Candidatus Geothermarchaeales archaeon]